MDKIVKNIATVEKCEIYAKNCINKGREDLAIQAKERIIKYNPPIFCREY